jgi:hypothetical protein
LAFEPKPPNAGMACDGCMVCDGCEKEKVEGTVGTGCAACAVLEPKLNVEPFVCAGVNEKGADALDAGCAAAVLFEPNPPNAGVPFVCVGCPNVKLDGADWEVLCPKTDGVGAWAESCPKLIWVCCTPNVNDELGGVNVDCCDCPNVLGEEMPLKLAPAALLPLAPSLDFGALILQENVSGVIRAGVTK